ncbi:MAG TPA: DUF721 domain-containing protein [Pirellulaceae bacterium]|jgi:hypothetical protein|nr:DUF721 domain-containing protein [Pirellulaceae bacterium]
MDPTESSELQALLNDAKNRQRFSRRAKPIGEVLSRLMSRRGYAQVQKMTELQAAVGQAVGRSLEKHCRPGKLSRGVLEIYVRNSSVLQELTFQKKQVLGKLAQIEEKIRDLKFRVGQID